MVFELETLPGPALAKHRGYAGHHGRGRQELPVPRDPENARRVGRFYMTCDSILKLIPLLLRRTYAGRGRTRRRTHARVSRVHARTGAAAGVGGGTRQAADGGGADAAGRLPERSDGRDSGRSAARRTFGEGSVAALPGRDGGVVERPGKTAAADWGGGPGRDWILCRAPGQHGPAPAPAGF